jgi:hypothetical protein
VVHLDRRNHTNNDVPIQQVNQIWRLFPPLPESTNKNRSSEMFLCSPKSTVRTASSPHSEALLKFVPPLAPPNFGGRPSSSTVSFLGTTTKASPCPRPASRVSSPTVGHCGIHRGNKQRIVQPLCLHHHCCVQTRRWIQPTTGNHCP